MPVVEEQIDVPQIRFMRWITVEPPIFFFALSLGLVQVSNSNLYIHRTCEVVRECFHSEIFGLNLVPTVVKN